jgi:hypothetical protein
MGPQPSRFFPGRQASRTPRSPDDDGLCEYCEGMPLLEIPNDRLKFSDVPAPEAKWDRIADFGLTLKVRKSLGRLRHAPR